MTRHSDKYPSILLILLFLLTLALSGCGSREHMATDYGVRNREFFAKQKVHPNAAEETPKGLDSEESALVQAAYRKSLGGGGGETASGPSKVLLLEDK